MTLLRKWDVNRPVHVYRNLTKGCWSVRQDGLVVAHTNGFILRDCTFHVQPAGRQKVLDTGVKNVHAYVRGVPVLWTNGEPDGGLSYNPKKSGNFILSSEGFSYAVDGAKYVRFSGRDVWAYEAYQTFKDDSSGKSRLRIAQMA